MRGSSRARILLPVAAVAVVALLGLSACGRFGGGGARTAPGDPGYSDLGWDGQALESIGFSPDELALVSSAQDDPIATPSSSPGATSPGATRTAKGGKARNLRHRLIKFGFGKNVLHAEGVVQTDEGTKTVVVQRGAVTAITSTSVTVKSSDGFTLTWSFGDPFTVVKDKARIEPSAVAVGTHVGIAGAKEGTATNARLMVVARTK